MKDIEKLRYWCVKILPLVYDDSLSYYEVLLKTTQKLNEVIENYNTIDEYIKELLEKGGYLDKIRQQIAPIIENDWFASGNRDMRQLVWLDGNLYWITKPVQAGNKYIDGVNVARITVEDLINLLKSTVVDSYETTLERASKARNVGDWIWYNHHLAEITKNIAIDELYKENVNFKYITIYEIYLREKKAREDGDNALSNSVNAEKTAREKADEALGKRIDAEALTRESNDNVLRNNINEETTYRRNADNDLGKRIDAEAQSRKTADDALSKRIDNIVLSQDQSVGAVSDKLNTEIRERKEADANFTTQINNLNTKVDLLEPKEKIVVEEVGTQGQTIRNLLQILATTALPKLRAVPLEERYNKVVLYYGSLLLHTYVVTDTSITFTYFQNESTARMHGRTITVSITDAKAIYSQYANGNWTLTDEGAEDSAGRTVRLYYLP